MENLHLWLLANNILLSSISYVAVIISVIFIAYQAKVFRNDCKKRNQKQEFTNSYNLANFYSEQIIHNMAATNLLLEKVGFLKLLNPSEKHAQYDLFDTQELNSIYSKEEINKANEILQSQIAGNYLCHFLVMQKQIPYYTIKMDLENVKKFYSNEEDAVETFYNDIQNQVIFSIGNTLNKLEYFSMFFESNLAEKDAIYMSIHQTFLQFIRNHYFFISKKNTNSSNKYYTHIISLYKHWSLKEKENREKQIQANKDMCEKPKKIS